MFGQCTVHHGEDVMAVGHIVFIIKKQRAMDIGCLSPFTTKSKTLAHGMLVDICIQNGSSYFNYLNKKSGSLIWELCFFTSYDLRSATSVRSWQKK